MPPADVPGGVTIRAEEPGHVGAVADLVDLAFGAEHGLSALVSDLRSSSGHAGAWVAEADGAVIGHVMLTRGWIDATRALVPCPVLSPLAVHPARQGGGVGAALVRHAVAQAEAKGAPAVVLEGDPAYYGRLGFECAADRGLFKPSESIPETAFQWIRLPAYEPWMRGRFVYPEVFWAHDAVGLREWRAQRQTGLAVSTVTIGARDLPRLARFYGDLLGLQLPEIEAGEDWVALHDTGGWSLAIQHEPDQEPVTWPAGPGEQHMQLHLEIRVEDLDAGVEHALACGAALARSQPQADVRVCLDPEGHPFCLWVETD